MNCRGVRDLLQPYLDSELDTVQTLSVNRHLEVCASCRQRMASERRIETAVAHHLRAGPAADAQVVERIVDRVLAQSPLRRSGPVLLAAAVLVSLGLLLLGPWRSTEAPPLLVTAAGADHAKYRSGLLVPDHPATTPQGVRDYLEGLLDITCPPLPMGGQWRLVGPRRCQLAGTPVGLVLLLHHEEPVSLFLLPPGPAAKLGWSPGTGTRCYPLAAGHAVIAQVRATGTVRCAVGDIPLAALERLAQAREQ